MASFVVVNIDTSSPNIEIYAPSYTTVDILNEITIQANEQLSLDYQEIYVVDANGVRYDYTFSFEGDKYVGYIKFNTFTVGSIVTLYAQVMDTVGNKSNLISKAIHISNSLTLLKMNISDSEATTLTINDKDRKVDVSDSEEVILTIDDKDMNIDINDKSSNIEVSDTDRGEDIDIN